MTDASLSVYRRPEAYYLVVSAKTSTGLWIDVPESPAVLGSAADAAELGGAVVDLLAAPRPAIPHPRRDEWTDVRRRSLGPIMTAAKVRSWKAFTATATLVAVGRTGSSFTVTPMRPPVPSDGGYEPDTDAEQILRSPSKDACGTAILDAFASIETA
jgi:hypothetical protein